MPVEIARRARPRARSRVRARNGASMSSNGVGERAARRSRSREPRSRSAAAPRSSADQPGVEIVEAPAEQLLAAAPLEHDAELLAEQREVLADEDQLLQRPVVEVEAETGQPPLAGLHERALAGGVARQQGLALEDRGDRSRPRLEQRRASARTAPARGSRRSPPSGSPALRTGTPTTPRAAAGSCSPAISSRASRARGRRAARCPGAADQARAGRSARRPTARPSARRRTRAAAAGRTSIGARRLQREQRRSAQRLTRRGRRGREPGLHERASACSASSGGEDGSRASPASSVPAKVYRTVSAAGSRPRRTPASARRARGRAAGGAEQPLGSAGSSASKRVARAVQAARRRPPWGYVAQARQSRRARSRPRRRTAARDVSLSAARGRDSIGPRRAQRRRPGQKAPFARKPPRAVGARDRAEELVERTPLVELQRLRESSGRSEHHPPRRAPADHDDPHWRPTRALRPPSQRRTVSGKAALGHIPAAAPLAGVAAPRRTDGRCTRAPPARPPPARSLPSERCRRAGQIEHRRGRSEVTVVRGAAATSHRPRLTISASVFEARPLPAAGAPRSRRVRRV